MQKPYTISFDNTDKISELRNQGFEIRDLFRSQIDELCEIRNPELRDEPQLLQKKQEEYFQKHKDSSIFCVIPWRKLCIRLVTAKLYHELHTARNKDLITHEEQIRFRSARIAIAGMSVGSNIARVCAMQGGPQVIHLADKDVYSISNLNRVLSGIHHVDTNKALATTEYLYEVDPFLNINIFDSGINSENCNDFMMSDGAPVDVLVEEIDSIEMKIELRKIASEHHVPVISIADNADGVIIDIERYDNDYTFDMFMKRLEVIKIDKNVRPKIEDIARGVTNFIGIDDIDTAMLESVARVGKTLYSWPQLGNAAVLAGSVGSFVIRQIVNGKLRLSGRYVINFSKIFDISDENKEKRRNNIISFYNV